MEAIGEPLIAIFRRIEEFTWEKLIKKSAFQQMIMRRLGRAEEFLPVAQTGSKCKGLFQNSLELEALG